MKRAGTRTPGVNQTADHRWRDASQPMNQSPVSVNMDQPHRLADWDNSDPVPCREESHHFLQVMTVTVTFSSPAQPLPARSIASLPSTAPPPLKCIFVNTRPIRRWKMRQASVSSQHMDLSRVDAYAGPRCRPFLNGRKDGADHVCCWD